MTDSPLISVIIPVYKTEKYLDRCLSSVVDQTYKNLEIILVDDGSPDRCPGMCDEWEARDPRIKVIHKKNGGLSDARNVGLDIMNGEYVTFIDSDDWVSPAYCESMYQAVLMDNSDLCVSGYLRTNEKDAVPSEEAHLINYSVIDSSCAIKFLFGSKNIKYVTACAKLYKSSLLSEIRFPIGKLHEDDFTTYKLYDKADTICEIDNRLYYYFINDQSITHNYSLKRLDALDAQFEKLSFITSNYPEFIRIATATYFGSCRYHFQMLCYNRKLDPKKKYRKQILTRIETIQLDTIKDYYRGKQKLWFDLFRIVPYTTSIVRNIFKIGW